MSLQRGGSTAPRPTVVVTSSKVWPAALRPKTVAMPTSGQGALALPKVSLACRGRGEAPRLKSLLRQIKLRRGSTSQRAKRRGWRWRHSKKVWKRHPAVRSSARKARAEWASVTTATQVLARGGELASVKRRDLTFHSSRRRRSTLRLRNSSPRAFQPYLTHLLPPRGCPFTSVGPARSTLTAAGACNRTTQ